jgi:hypothetical protein
MTGFTKISVLLFYRRLVARTFSKKLKWAIWIAIGIVAVYPVALALNMLNMCYPLKAEWEAVYPDYTAHYICQSEKALDSTAIAGGILSVVTDFYSVTLPATLVFNIRITGRQRLGLFVIFGLGYL